MTDNPYQPASQPTSFGAGGGPSIEEQKMVETIIKDANQFYIAIIICILCSALGCFIIAPWYFLRLRQWEKLAKNQPMLMDKAVGHGSTAQKFQSAKVKLQIGIAFGCVMTVVWVLFLAIVISQN